MAQTKTVEQLPCQLTGEELLIKGQQLARLGDQVESLRASLKASAAATKAEIDAIEEKVVQLRREINRGEEERPIECLERPRYQDMIVDIVRVDLGTIVYHRPMHPSEKQLAMEVGGMPISPNPPAGKKKKRAPAPEEETVEGAH